METKTLHSVSIEINNREHIIRCISRKHKETASNYTRVGRRIPKSELNKTSLGWGHLNAVAVHGLFDDKEAGIEAVKAAAKAELTRRRDVLCMLEDMEATTPEIQFEIEPNL